jgi:hypothetical protein
MSKKIAPEGAVKQGKDNNFNHLSQEQLINIALTDIPKTRRQLEVETGVHTNTIDWLVSGLMKSGVVFIAEYGKCPITGSEGVQFITSNNDFRPKPTFIQQKLF